MNRKPEFIGTEYGGYPAEKDLRVHKASEHEYSQQRVAYALGLAHILKAKGFRLPTRCSNLKILWSAQLDPPITSSSLKYLESDSIRTDLEVRHAVNFEGEIVFRRRMQAQFERHTRGLQSDYWQALEIEILLRSGPFSTRSGSGQSVSQVTKDLDFIQVSGIISIPCRLARILSAIGDLLTGLTHPLIHHDLSSLFGIARHVQQIDHGISFLPNVLRRLRSILIQSRLRLKETSWRDHLERAANNILQNCWNKDISFICNGLYQILQNLEALKVVCLKPGILNYKTDVYHIQEAAKQYVADNQDCLLHDYIRFEQFEIAKRIMLGHDRLNWLDTAQSQTSSEPEIFQLFLRSFMELIVSGQEDLPMVWYLDRSRIRLLQSQMYHGLLTHASLQLFDKLALALPHPHFERREELREKLQAMLYKCLLKDRQQQEFVALAIVRETYSFCFTVDFPIDGVDKIRDAVWSIALPTFQRARNITVELLSHLVQIEARKMLLLSNVEMAKRYGIRHSSEVALHYKIAHLAVLHWRVWAPFVYLNPLSYPAE